MQTWYHCENTYPFVPPEVLAQADSVRGSLPNRYCDPKIQGINKTDGLTWKVKEILERAKTNVAAGLRKM